MIRAYKLADWEAAREIYDLSKPAEMGTHVPPGAIIPLDRDKQMLADFEQSEKVVFDDGGKVIGFAGRREEIVSWLFVHPDRRGRGAGRALLEQIILLFPPPLHLNVVRTNHVAIRLYQSLGFELANEFDGKMYGYAVPAVRMELRALQKSDHGD